MKYYLDTSALLKKYVRETGSVWLQGLLAAPHPLRAYDAIHLATALTANHRLLASGAAGLVFLCADDRLLQAAATEGLAVDTPNDHP